MDDSAIRAAHRDRLITALTWSMAFVVLLGGLFFARPWLGDLPALALRPRDVSGLLGIVTAPLLHGSIEHLFSNAVPLLFMGTLCGLVYPRASRRALPLIWLGAGLGTWLIGRDSFHIGASGLTHGLGFFLFVLGLLRRDRPAIATALMVFFLYGGMLLTVLPREPGVSWEYHLSGALAGALAAWRWYRLDPAPPRPRYSWEDEADADVVPDDTLEPPRPQAVPVLWLRPPGAHDETRDETRGVVLPFRRTVDPQPPMPQRKPL